MRAKKKADKIRRVYYGDNLPILREMSDNIVDLIYLDPPFNSNRDYNAIFRDPPGRGAGRDAKRQIKAFHDTWEWSPLCDNLAAEVAEQSANAGKILAAFIGGLGKCSMTAYLANMSARLVELRRVLKPTGSVYLHCDPAANSYLRVLMDAVFGAGNFRNEIVWAYGLGGSSKRMFSRKHDTILFYTKSGKWHFDKPLVPSSSAMLGGREKGMLDVWADIPSLNNMAKERTGYPTQKPLALLKRIIGASSAKGDLVLDPFCGCGTAPEAAEQLGRHWIGIDIAYRAVGVLRARMTREDETVLPNFDRDVEIIGEPKTVAEVREKTGTEEAKARHEFEVFCIVRLGGIPKDGPGPDGGVDGRIPIRRHPGCYAIAEVKSGAANIDDLRALSDLTRQSELEPAGVLILRDCAPQKLEKWRREAQKRGEWRKGIPRLQIVTLEDILRGRKPKGVG